MNRFRWSVIAVLLLSSLQAGFSQQTMTAGPFSESESRNVVGCVFPLSGRFAGEGKKAQDAVMLSVRQFRARSPLTPKIVTADSGAGPAMMKKAIARLAAEEKVVAIIAVSGTAEAGAAAAEAQNQRVPVILITPREAVTEAGDRVFQHFLTPAQQVEALTDYAMNDLRIRVFGTLYPGDDYGEEMNRLFCAEVQGSGGRIARSVSYPMGQTDFRQQIRELSGEKEGASRLSDKQDGSAITTELEGLFVPDSAFRARMINAQLAFYNIRRVRIFGTSLWNTPDLVRQNNGYMEGAFFVDSFHARGSAPETVSFTDAYRAIYNREPQTMEALAYDTMRLVLSILADPEIETRDGFAQALLATRDFQGATGGISFGGGRVARKQALILKVQDGEIVQVR
ncbi:MAG TPA: penicillin-binding protein activator [Smithellaceae bacterium]|nr:penicillin-binding protein activator [Smithellaceae bacterium]HRV44447.1 penicillin-binding protein activator [Smithellaceae bacterium]